MATKTYTYIGDGATVAKTDGKIVVLNKNDVVKESEFGADYFVGRTDFKIKKAAAEGGTS